MTNRLATGLGRPTGSPPGADTEPALPGGSRASLLFPDDRVWSWACTDGCPRSAFSCDEMWWAARLPVAESSPRRARGLVSAACTDWGLSAVADSAVLVISELVTNAVRHARWPGPPTSRLVTVVVRHVGRSVVVEVRDPDPRQPVPRPRPDWDALDIDELPQSGNGLHMVADLSADTGTRRLPDGYGKAVWAVLREPASASAR